MLAFFLFILDKIVLFVYTSVGDYMKNFSIWRDTVKRNKYNKLLENIETDILIIGGGITGISTLFFLEKSNYKVTLVEQNRIGSAVTGNSTGKLSYLQNDLIDKIRSNFGDKNAREYINSQIAAIDMIVNIVNDNKIDCDLKKVNSYLYTNKTNEVDKLQKLEKFLCDMNINIYHNDIDYVKYKYCFGVGDTYLFHPLKFVQGLALKCKSDIYEYTSIKKINKENDYYLCYTEKFVIKAKYVVIASHYPYFNLPFLFPIKASLEKSYLSASIYNGDDVSYISYSNPFISIRNYNDYLIYLSNSHDVTIDINDTEHYEELFNKISDLQLSPSYMWSNIDIMTSDGLPYIGRLSGNILIGTGYNTWGLTNGVLAGKILSDIFACKDNKYIELFSPRRVNISQIEKGFVNGIKSIQGYVRGYLNKNDSIVYEKYDGKDIMIYSNGTEEYMVYRNCPHLGCKLIFNELEKTWDCPCHGSRFDLNGKCISGPSNSDISIVKD